MSETGVWLAILGALIILFGVVVVNNNEYTQCETAYIDDLSGYNMAQVDRIKGYDYPEYIVVITDERVTAWPKWSLNEGCFDVANTMTEDMVLIIKD